MKSITAFVVLFALPTFGQQASITHNVNLRKAAHRRAAIIETIPAGQHVEIVGASRGSFYRVKAADGQEGWAWQKNVFIGNLSTNTALMALVQPHTEGGDRAHSLVSEASGAEAESCGHVSGWDACHQHFDAGCTSAAHPGYDAYLNYLKNEIPDPTAVVSKSVRTLTSLDDFLEFDQQSQDLKLGKKPQIQFGAKLADVGQGNIFTTVGYIYYAQKGGDETCNCQLAAEVDRDVHIGVGFDSEVARGITDGSVGAKDSRLTQTSIIAEMTPHFRGTYHSNWSAESVQGLAGRQVKLVGQLLVDNEHNVAAQNCAFQNAGPNCWRASVWEMHPVFAMYVCNSATGCSADSTDGWDEVP